MTDGLEESWERTKGHLARAWVLLPPSNSEGDLAGYTEYLDHNELELAMEELERVATERGAPLDFWKALADAAMEMRLPVAEQRYRTLAIRQA